MSSTNIPGCLLNAKPCTEWMEAKMSKIRALSSEYFHEQPIFGQLSCSAAKKHAKAGRELWRGPRFWVGVGVPHPSMPAHTQPKCPSSMKSPLAASGRSEFPDLQTLDSYSAPWSVCMRCFLSVISCSSPHSLMRHIISSPL